MYGRARLTSEQGRAGPSTYTKLRILIIYQQAPKAVPRVRSKLVKRRRNIGLSTSTTNPATKDVGSQRLGRTFFNF